MTVVEISECFPNNYKPVTGEFILQHSRSLSQLCRVIVLVPLRLVPPKELFFPNPLKTISGIYKWFSVLRSTTDFNENNLSVIYFYYVSLPRPAFESVDNRLINFFFYKRIRKILNGYNPDIIYCNWIRPWADLSSKLAKEFNVPFVIDHHEDIPTLKKLFPNSFKNFLDAFKKADVIVAHSTVNKNELSQELNGIQEARIIPLGQNFPIDANQKKFSSGKLKLICVSHLYERRKNIDDLIKALAKIKSKLEFELIIAGEGNLKQEYIQLTSSLGLDNEIIFTGEKSQKEIGALLDASDIFILPSYPEAFGVVLIEALAKGLPVITCRGNGGGEELMLLGYPIILVNRNSPGELADAILDLSKDKNKMLQMSDKGKEIVKNNFTWEKNSEKTFSLLHEISDKFKKKNNCAE